MIYKVIDIWEDYSTGCNKTGISRPKLTCYILDGETKRGAVILLPGGAFRYRSKRESEPVALQYTAAGYNVFILDYSVEPDRFPKALQDVCRSTTIIRQNAIDWNVDTDQITVMGFSAGGHVAASHGVFWNRPELFTAEGIDTALVKPNALILAYPVITSGTFSHQNSIKTLIGNNPSPEQRELVSLENQVSCSTPPVFLWHTFEDESVPVENSLLFASSLKEHNIPFELHIYSRGSHGLALATEATSNGIHKPDNHVASWMTLSIQWMKTVFV